MEKKIKPGDLVKAKTNHLSYVRKNDIFVVLSSVKTDSNTTYEILFSGKILKFWINNFFKEKELFEVIS